MKKRTMTMAGLVGLALVQAASAGIIIGGTVNNGNLDADGTSSGWDTAVAGNKWYLNAGGAGLNAYRGGWTVVRNHYLGGNNAIGFNDESPMLVTGLTPNDMVCFANTGGMNLNSDSYAATLLSGDDVTVGFKYATGNISGVSFTSTLVFDEGLGSEATFALASASPVAADTEYAYSDTLNLTTSYSTVAVHINMEGPDGQGKQWVDDVSVSVIPEPATLGMVAVFGGGILFVRRRFMI